MLTELLVNILIKINLSSESEADVRCSNPRPGNPLLDDLHNLPPGRHRLHRVLLPPVTVSVRPLPQLNVEEGRYGVREERVHDV